MTLTELKAMIEAEALRRQASQDAFTLDSLKAWLGQSSAPPPGVLPEAPPPPAELDYAYFANLQWRDLVRACYVNLLGREPDPAGAERFLAMLAAGEDKAFVVGRIAFSAEGRSRKRRVRGLLLRYAFAEAKKVPVAGRIVAWFLALASLGREQRNARAFQQHVFFRLDALGRYAAQSGDRVSLKLDALRAVLESRD